VVEAALRVARQLLLCRGKNPVCTSRTRRNIMLSSTWRAKWKRLMSSVEQCRANAAKFKKLGADPTNSARRLPC
jgi:hypothetical protein